MVLRFLVPVNKNEVIILFVLQKSSLVFVFLVWSASLFSSKERGSHYSQVFPPTAFHAWVKGFWNLNIHTRLWNPLSQTHFLENLYFMAASNVAGFCPKLCTLGGILFPYFSSVQPQTGLTRLSQWTIWGFKIGELNTKTAMRSNQQVSMKCMWMLNIFRYTSKNPILEMHPVGTSK